MRVNVGRQNLRSIADDGVRSEYALNQAWRILDLVNSLVRVADAKAGVILATTGVGGGTLYGMLRGDAPRGVTASLSAITAVLLTCSAVCAGYALRPRRGAGLGRGARHAVSANLLFFEHIAHIDDEDWEEYGAALRRLLLEPEKLADQIAHQIWHNAKVASTKYNWIERSLAFLWWAVPVFAAVVVTVTW